MTARTILGHIDCPHCHAKGSMRITPDKNGAPFGFCEVEACGGQLRVGGKPGRVRAFYAAHPHVKRPDQVATEPAPAPVTVTPPAPTPAPTPTPAPKRPSAFDYLLNGGRA